MAIRKPNVKIENGKVVFSKEILDYFESIRSEENSEWINKYFDVLSDPSNFNAEKFNIHHIKPCFTFKDENHKIRKETELLANAMKENKIKISIYNHVLAHYYLWKIFNNWDSKNAIRYVCQNKNIEFLNEKEIKEIAEIKENYTKSNQTKEEKDKSDKRYRDSHKKEMSEYGKKRRKEKGEELKQQGKKYREEHKEDIAKYREEHKEEHKAYMQEYRKNNKEELAKTKHDWDMRNCKDPIKNDNCSFCALKKRIQNHLELYKNINADDCIIKTKNQQ